MSSIEDQLLRDMHSRYSSVTSAERKSKSEGIDLPWSHRRNATANRNGRHVSADSISNWVMILIAGAGLSLASYLSWIGLSSSKVVGCGDGQVFDCSHVIYSKWSTVFEMPVALPATALYVTTLLAIVTRMFSQRDSVRRIASSVVIVASVAAALAAVWFTALQMFVLKHMCSYCLAAHGCGLVLAITAWWSLSIGTRRKAMLSVLSFMSVAILAVGQMFGGQPATFQIENHNVATVDSKQEGTLTKQPALEPPLSNPVTPKQEETQEPLQELRQDPIEKQAENPAAEVRRVLTLSGGQVKLDISQWPITGKADAKQVFVEMFDYTCPHCRENHSSVKSAMDQLGEKVAVIAIGVPMNKGCNNAITKDDPVHAEACELARLSVAVWRTDATKFPEFHEWMFTGDAVPTLVDAKAHADSLVGADKLDAELAQDISSKYVMKQVEIFKAVGAGQIPKLLFESKTVSGKVESADTILDIFKEQDASQKGINQ